MHINMYLPGKRLPLAITEATIYQMGVSRNSIETLVKILNYPCNNVVLVIRLLAPNIKCQYPPEIHCAFLQLHSDLITISPLYEFSLSATQATKETVHYITTRISRELSLVKSVN